MSIRMKRFATAAFAVAAVVVMMMAMAVSIQARPDPYNEASYQAWCDQYGKDFCSPAERMRRSVDYMDGFELYKRQVAYVERHNANPESTFSMRVGSHFFSSRVGPGKEERGGGAGASFSTTNGGSSGGYSLTIFSGAGAVAGTTLYTGVPVDTGEQCTMGTVEYWNEGVAWSQVTPPAFNSCMTSTGLPAIDDQGPCASCTAHVAMKIVNQKATNFGYAPVSSTWLVNCALNGNQGCNGGYSSNYFDYMNSNGYSSSDTAPCGTGQNFRGGINYMYLQEEAYIPYVIGSNSRNMNRIVGVYLQVTPSFVSYSNGTFNGPDCPTGAALDLDHGVAVVGYCFFGTPQQYWLIHNSWSTRWGMSGTAKILANQGICGLGQYSFIDF